MAGGLSVLPMLGIGNFVSEVSLEFSVSQPVGRGPQVGRGQFSMGIQSSHLLSFTTKLFNFLIMNHQV